MTWIRNSPRARVRWKVNELYQRTDWLPADVQQSCLKQRWRALGERTPRKSKRKSRCGRIWQTFTDTVRRVYYHPRPLRAGPGRPNKGCTIRVIPISLSLSSSSSSIFDVSRNATNGGKVVVFAMLLFISRSAVDGDDWQ